MTKDLTTGKIMPIFVNFTVPLVLGNLFQLTYNAVDSIIVGHFVGKEALAAVGICNPVSTLMILFLNGLCMGASIPMGIQYGAKIMRLCTDRSVQLCCLVRFFVFSHIGLCNICGTYSAVIAGRSVYYGYDSAIFADYFSGINVYIFI